MHIDDVIITPVANETVEIRVHLSSHHLNSIYECLKRNVAKDNIKVNSLRLTTNNEAIIIVGGIEGFVPDFINLLTTEIMVAGIIVPQKESKKKSKMKCESCCNQHNLLLGSSYENWKK